jgi:hypothetical protein
VYNYGPIWHGSTSLVEPFFFGFSSTNCSFDGAEAILTTRLAKQLLTVHQKHKMTTTPLQKLNFHPTRKNEFKIFNSKVNKL